MDNGRAERIAAVERELAEALAVVELVDATEATESTQSRERSANGQGFGSTVVISMRLAPEEARALERRATALGTTTSALARSYVRRNVCAPVEAAPLDTAVARLEVAVADLRALVP